jgi:cbb3-type cytochrome oxidase maturation protein
MQIIFIMVGASLVIALLFLFAFLWSVKSGQYDDTVTPSMRILFDNPKQQNQENDN